MNYFYSTYCRLTKLKLQNWAVLSIETQQGHQPSTEQGHLVRKSPPCLIYNVHARKIDVHEQSFTLYTQLQLAIHILYSLWYINTDMQSSSDDRGATDAHKTTNAKTDTVAQICAMYGTLPQSATRPLKTYSTAVRAIPLSACHQGPPSGNRTGFKNVRTRSKLFS